MQVFCIVTEHVFFADKAILKLLNILHFHNKYTNLFYKKTTVSSENYLHR